MARRKVKVTVDDYARAVLIVYEAMDHAQTVCDWADRDRLYQASELLRDSSVAVKPAALVVRQ